MTIFDHRFCVAPLMAYTDRHFRYLLRLLSPSAVLYTEMVVDQAIQHGDRRRLLTFSPEEHPVALQLGGSVPKQLATAVSIAAPYGYDEINLNVGCPSERVQSGCFGAALMKTPGLVAECVSAMREASDLPVTVKTRLGVDECDSDYFLADLVGRVVEAGCPLFILHARKAWLSGLSPKENRSVPPLQYERVYQLKRQFPELPIVINGGIHTEADIHAHLNQVDGVMLGRAVCQQPYCLTTFSASRASVPPSRETILRTYLAYMEVMRMQDVPLRQMSRHLIGLYQGQAGAKQWRRTLTDTNFSENALWSFLVKQAERGF